MKAAQQDLHQQQSITETTRPGLPKHLEEQLLLDLEDHFFLQGTKLNSICKNRPEYGKKGSHLQRQVQNRSCAFQRLRRNDTTKYLKLLSLARARAQPNDNLDFPPSLPENANMPSSWAAATPKKQKAITSSPTWKEPPLLGSPTASSFRDPYELFSSFEEAEDAADDVITVNFDYPEKNGGFFIHRINNLHHPNGEELMDQLKIILPLVDARDFKTYKATLVLGGTAIYMETPSVPYFLLHNHQDIFLTESVSCNLTKDAHTVHANQIMNNGTRQIRSFLLVFPDGMKCTPFIETKKKNTHKIQICVRRIEAQFEVGNAVTNQQFFPAYWLIRIHEDDKRMLKRTAEEEEEDSLAHAFRGTKIH